MKSETVVSFLSMPYKPQLLHLGQRPAASMSSDLCPLFDCTASALCSATGTVVGSLHPDDLDLLPPVGSKIELLVIARSFKITEASSLLGVIVAKQDPKLIWVIYVVWVH